MRTHFEEYTLQIDDGSNDGDRYYLFIKVTEPMRTWDVEGVEITHPTVDELAGMLKGKRLLFTCDCYFDTCAADETLSKKLHEYIFKLRNEKAFYYSDQYFDVRIFLQRVSADDDPECRYMQPIDVRNLDINAKLLSILKEKSSWFFGDAETATYAAESEKLQAQYFLSKFHSNRNWSADPVNILNCRISAFELPCSISLGKARAAAKDRIANDRKNRIKYMIDSIHVNTDICFGVSEFRELFEDLMYGISLD